MIEVYKYKELSPQLIEGRVRLDLTNPRTGKVIERVEGKNHIFTDVFFGKEFSSALDWVTNVSNAWLCMNDNSDALDENFPFLKGQTLGYGKPSTAGTGLYRGAYNAANQVLNVCDLEKIRWVFQYDFTTAQANGTIRNVGLTKQYQSPAVILRNGYRTSGVVAGWSQKTCDGVSCYTINNTTKVITKFNMLTGATSEIDVSAVVGTLASYLSIGYAPDTGKGYIWGYSSTAANRRMYEFSDMTFASLANTWTPTNLTHSNSSCLAFYVFSGKAYFTISSNNTIRKADFANNLSYTDLVFSSYNNAAYTELTSNSVGEWDYNTLGIPGTTHIFLPGNTAGKCKSIILDLSTESIVAYTMGDTNLLAYYSLMAPKAAANKLVAQITGQSSAYPLLLPAALTTYILPTPVTKTSANGLTVTYEVEVYW